MAGKYGNRESQCRDVMLHPSMFYLSTDYMGVLGQGWGVVSNSSVVLSI